LNKLPVLESLAVNEAKAVIITVSSEQNKRLISQAVTEFSQDVEIIVKIDSVEERKSMKDLQDVHFVDASAEISKLLVNHALKA
jgi:monovalent cation:H+ antiporter-2, CPA2 family